MGSLVLCSRLLPELWSLKLSKIVHFLQFFADVIKKPKAVIANYLYASQTCRFALLQNSIGYYAMT